MIAAGSADILKVVDDATLYGTKGQLGGNAAGKTAAGAPTGASVAPDNAATQVGGIKPTVIGLVSGGLLSAVFALTFGPVFLRIKGVHFVLLTYAFGQIVK